MSLTHPHHSHSIVNVPLSPSNLVQLPITSASSGQGTGSSGSGSSGSGPSGSTNNFYTLNVNIGASKYQENGDALSDFVNLVCQEAQNNNSNNSNGQVSSG